MKITRVSVYSVDLPGKGGGYRRTTGLSPATNVSTIVKVDTDEGISGLGEVCPLGTHYMRGWAGAAQSGIPILARMILGEDPSKFVLNTTDLTDYVEVSIADGCPRRDGAVLRASSAPGLGLTPREEVLGAPVAVVE